VRSEKSVPELANESFRAAGVARALVDNPVAAPVVRADADTLARFIVRPAGAAIPITRR
jgi:hypothetical protein